MTPAMVSLKGFLAENSISRSREPRPRVVRIGRKILIRAEDAAAWRERLASRREGEVKAS